MVDDLVEKFDVLVLTLYRFKLKGGHDTLSATRDMQFNKSKLQISRWLFNASSSSLTCQMEMMEVGESRYMMKIHD